MITFGLRIFMGDLRMKQCIKYPKHFLRYFIHETIFLSRFSFLSWIPKNMIWHENPESSRKRQPRNCYRYFRKFVLEYFLDRQNIRKNPIGTCLFQKFPSCDSKHHPSSLSTRLFFFKSSSRLARFSIESPFYVQPGSRVKRAFVRS